LDGTQPNVKVEPNLTFDGETLFVNREVYPIRYIETYVNLDNVTGTVDINLNNGNNFYARVTGATTFTFSNPPASGQGFGFTLLLKVVGSFTITWPTTIKWPSGITPSVTGDDNGLDAFVFYTYDNGATYYGLTGGLNLRLNE